MSRRKFIICNDIVYKACCCNCKYYCLSEENAMYGECTCKEKMKEYMSSVKNYNVKNYNNIYTIYHKCKYFEFEPRVEDTSDISILPPSNIEKIYYVSESGNKIMDDEIVSKIRCIHREGNHDTLVYDNKNKAYKCKLCGAELHPLNDDEIFDKYTNDTFKYDVLESLKIMCHSDPEKLSMIKKLLVEYYDYLALNRKEEVIIPKELIKSCISYFTNLCKFQQTEPVQTSHEYSNDPENYVYFKGKFGNERIIGKENLNFVATKMYVASDIKSICKNQSPKYEVTYLSSGAVAFFDRLDFTKLSIHNLREIDKDEYELLSTILKISDEFYLHDYKIGYPRKDSVNSYLNDINRLTKKLRGC